ncbi:hypothetical protein [Nonomuraea sp. NPDC049400]|uniref:hypothetical protein n=1 Tax=Nonomuraea sp. NPDC049400 TaxID=3364352 RepID=UPI0037AEED5E
MRRVLRPGGRLIASVQHPLVDYLIQDPRPNYFATTSYTDEWTFDGQSFPMTFWRRPLHAMTDAFTTAGFRLDGPIVERREGRDQSRCNSLAQPHSLSPMNDHALVPDDFAVPHT